MKAKGWLAIAALVLIAGCGKKEAEVAEQKPAETKPAEQQQATETAQSATNPKIPQVAGDTVTTASGLKYIEMTAGTGATPQAGQTVETHYTVWLSTGLMIDSSRLRGQTLSFALGQGTMIKGFEEAIASMKIGGRRLLIIPPELAWGSRGREGIPPNATVVFDVEVVSAK